MALIKTVRGCTPTFGENCYLAENATLVGDLVTGKECSFWFNAVVRADVNGIRMGDRVNVQDGAVVHCTFEKVGTRIGNDVSIGHNAIVHGCTIENEVLIGMGSIVMDNALVHSRTIVAAGAVVTEGSVLESGYIYAGVPARRIKKINAALLDGEIRRIARNYTRYASWFKDE